MHRSRRIKIAEMIVDFFSQETVRKAAELALKTLSKVKLYNFVIGTCRQDMYGFDVRSDHRLYLL